MGLNQFIVLILLAPAVAAIVLTPLVGRLAKALEVVDTPNSRKVHRLPIPRIGGLAIAVATGLPLAAWVVLRHLHIFGLDSMVLAPGAVHQLGALGIGALCILVVGLIDDIYELPSKYKLLALFAASAVLCASGGLIHSVVVGGHTYLELGQAAWPVTMLWIVGITVSINFIDGLDGLAAGIVLVGALVLAAASFVGVAAVPMILGLSLAGALAGFLVFNTHPASIFMGDCGSMFIGYVLAGGCAIAAPQIGTTRGLVLPAIALTVPLFDTLFTMVRRSVLQRRSVFAAERGHIHHRLLDCGLRHGQVVLLLYLATLGGGGVAMVGLYGDRITATVVAVLYCVGLAGLFRTAGSVRARETLLAMRRNRALGREAKKYQHAYYDLQLRFREVRSVDEWWTLMCKAGEVLDFAKIDVRMTRRDNSEATLRWRRDAELVAAGTSINAEVPIPQRRSGQTLRAEVEVLVNEFLESGGQRVALFSRLCSEFSLDRLPQTPHQPLAEKNAALVEVAEANKIEAEQDPGAFAGLRVAIVHDFLYTYAGAERVLEQLIKVCPHADVFSLFDFVPKEQRGFLQNRPVTTSFLQKMPLAKSRHRLYLPLMPLAIEQLDVSQYDMVVSSSYVAAKGVITRPDQLHICYCHTPVRFAWDQQNQYLGQAGLRRGLRGVLAKFILHYIRNWDVRSAHGVDVFLTNSEFVGRRIQKLYRRKSETIYPPVDVDRFALHEQKEDYYLTASRMVPYKRIDLIVEAFARMPNRRLIVVGDGPEMQRIQAKAGPNVTIVGHESDDELRKRMQLAKAFVFAAEEDFGITPVEAQACGTPVIAFGRGGATETVINQASGIFFHEQTPQAIMAAVERFEQTTWNATGIRAHAERFSPDQFRRGFTEVARREWAAFKAGQIIEGAPIGEIDADAAALDDDSVAVVPSL